MCCKTGGRARRKLAQCFHHRLHLRMSEVELMGDFFQIEFLPLRLLSLLVWCCQCFEAVQHRITCCDWNGGKRMLGVLFAMMARIAVAELRLPRVLVSPALKKCLNGNTPLAQAKYF